MLLTNFNQGKTKGQIHDISVPWICGRGYPVSLNDSFPLEFVKLFANSIFLDNHMYAKASDLKNEAWTAILFSIFLISIFIYTLNSTTTKCYAWMI